MLSFSPTLFKY